MLGNPFEEDMSEWALPSGFVPNVETVNRLRGLAGMVKLMDQEIQALAEFLNDDREARHAWPGSPMFRYLHRLFSSAEGFESGRAHLGAVLAELDRQCSAVLAPPDEESELPPGAMREEEITLPEIRHRTRVAAEGSRVGFDVDLNTHSCSCPGWFGNRRFFAVGDLRRCCVHMAAAFSEIFQEQSERRHARILVEFLNERAWRGRGVEVRAAWRLFKIRMRPVLVSLTRDGRCSVYAFDEGMVFNRYVYHPEDGRWAFGQAPAHHRVLARHLANSDESSSLPA